MILNKEKTTQFIDRYWDENIIPTLSKFISIPCKTPNLDKDWQKNGYLKQAADLLANWMRAENIQGAKIEVATLPNKTPFICAEIPGTIDKTILFYGHFDKMPEAEGWNEGLGPWTPTIKNNRLYGRGAVDDGYAAFAPFAAIKALREQNIPHGRCIVVLEGTEECGSIDFAAYLEHFEATIGSPDLVICNDAGGGNYDQIWGIRSLRGVVSGSLKVEILKRGIHSGDASGIVPSSFRIARQLLSRIEDEKTGKILLPEFYSEIPKERIEEAQTFVKIVGHKIIEEIPFVENAKPMAEDLVEIVLNKTWRPYLAIIGAEGIPLPQNAGNVLRASTSLQMSIRIPPLVDPAMLQKTLKETLEKDPPYGAKITYSPIQGIFGWNAPTTAPWLSEALLDGSKTFFGNEPAFNGEGGAIGIIQMLGNKFPEAQLLVSGLLGPDNNAHGPNEMLDIPAAKKYTCCLAEIVAAHYKQMSKNNI